MHFQPKKAGVLNKDKYLKEDVDIAYTFARKVWKEFQHFVKGIVLFGSKARRNGEKGGDIDILLIIDDVSFVINKNILERYRMIVEKTILETSNRIHVTTMNFTSFWEYTRVGDPLAVNILREGIAMIDTGFFFPMQMLLYQGRIRPSKESILAYYSRAPQAVANSKWHLVQATLDLYWATIDAAHAALMAVGEIPPAPSEISKMLDKHVVKRFDLPEKHVKTMEYMYNLSRKILHHQIKEIKGKDYDLYLHHSYEFVKAMRDFIKHRKVI